ncbi:FtsK/SpoIIIE domain-containing protein [Oerskovia flava]|uniref:FtsK/SpoIIIE domain-containing protein n=1 Tax=Oerskovia flava TaxID=2986422 RepID=UPI0022401647|nr:FtsK/SpoIIIE domain-containing protein [Oerskovia sp. JB1-3-2]
MPLAPDDLDPSHPIRLTVHPGTDVLVAAGTRVAALRGELAGLLCRPELLTTPLAVGRTVLGDDHVLGTRPVLPGAVLRPAGARTGPVDPATAADALRSAFHVARTAGARAGTLHPVTDGRPGGQDARQCGGQDDGTQVGRLRVRQVRARRSGRAPRVRVAAPHATRWSRAGREPRRRLVPRRWRTWRVGTSLLLDGEVYSLRARPDLAAVSFAGRTVPRVPDEGAASHRTPLGATLAMALTPAVASVAMAAVYRQPLFLLFALVGPLTLLVPLLLDARRRRAARRAAAGPHGGGAGPGTGRDVGGGTDRVRAAASSGAAGGAGAGSAGEHVGRPDPLHPRPCDALTSAIAAHVAPGDAAQDGDRRRSRGVPPRTPDHGPADVPDLPDGCLAVVGPRDRAPAAARAILAELVAGGRTIGVAHTDAHTADWAWCRWIPGSARLRRADLAAPAPSPRVLVVDGLCPDWSADLAAWWSRGPTEPVVLVARDPEAVPAWCRTVLDVRRDRARWSMPDGVGRTEAHTGVSTDWAEAFARHVAAAAHLGRWPATDDVDGADPAGRLLGAPGTTDTGRADPTSAALPGTVALGELLGAPADGLTCEPTTERWVADRWAADVARLAVPLGIGPDGRPVVVDLRRHGPHALVAGTTGAGKSELLQSLVLGLALTTSPRDLAFALVDYKGGASFGDCVRLPHVVGQVTDLEPGLAGRALAGLRAELRRREHVLADAGVARLDDLPPGVLPRLVVVIDEFRAMADELPDFLPGLLRVAAQGRSLGVHLVLATQRPAGAVSADMRANITLRLALRVVDPGDSQDVVEVPHAARIPATAPGRVILRHASAPATVVQCAHAAGIPRPVAAPVRRARPWGRLPRTTRAPTADPGVVRSLVDAARAAAASAGLHPAAPPWLPGLPSSVELDELHGLDGTDDLNGTDRTLPLALGDLPDEQRRTVVSWDPDDGHLAVVGRSRSGRSTALRTLAAAAVDRGWHVHLVAAPADMGELIDHPGVGTVVDRDDPRRVARLLRLLTVKAASAQPLAPLATPAPVPAPAPVPVPVPVRTLVLVDGVEGLRGALAPLGGGAGADLLADVLGDAHGVAFAVTADGPTLGGLAHRTGPRLVLSSTDKHDDVALGVPGPLAGRGGRPGRAVWLGRDGAVECQIARGGPAAARRGVGTAEVHEPIRLEPLPRHVRLADLGARTAGLDRVVVGLGGDHGGPVTLDAHEGALVVGPPGSGRTTALTLLARAAATTGTLRAVLARDRTLTSAGLGVGGDGGDVLTLARFAAAPLGGLLDELRAHPPGVLVVDDLDVLAQHCPLENETLADMCRDGWALLAGAGTMGAGLALRGALAELRTWRCGVVLAPGERGSAEVFGVPLDHHTDPGPPHPGRGVVVQGRSVVPVQVADSTWTGTADR